MGPENGVPPAAILRIEEFTRDCEELHLHHSSADTYKSYRNSAMRWEEQQRLFNDFDFDTSGKKVHSLSQEEDTSYGTEYYSYDDGWYVDSLQGRCTRCGSRRHDKDSFTVDMSKIRCFFVVVSMDM